MARYVIDPPMLLHLVETARPVAPSHRLVAPNSLRSDAIDLLLQRVRRGALAEADALELHERMTELKIRLLGDRVSRRTAWRIAREHGFDSLKQAEYVAITLLHADALITEDADAHQHAGELVTLASLEDLFVAD